MSEAKYRQIVEMTREGITTTDAEGRFTFANRRSEEMLGFEPGELLGKHIRDLMDDEGRALADQYQRERREGISGAGEFKLKRKDARDLWVRFASSPLMDDEGGFAGTLTIATDITEQRLANQAKAEMEARLILSDRMSSVGTLAAGVGHEINNPLSYVMANLELIAEEIRGIAAASPSARLNEMEQMVGEARQGADRIRKIVKGLRTLSRADEERRALIDVHAVLDLSINMAFNEIRHRARLVKDYSALPPVEADEARLGQVFINLLVNAAHAIPEGHADANEIRLVTKTEGSDRAVIEVRDTGCGLLADVQKRIFDPFFTTKPIGEGTGLGLAICHGIVTSLGGEITVVSEVGRGSIFRVVLPAANLHSVEEVRLPVSVRPRPGRRCRVLIVDDDPMVGGALRRTLRDHDVVSLLSGKEALDQLRAGERFDVIISDLMMPEMTGIQLHAEVLALLPEMAEKMVFITGGAFTPAARAFLDDVPNERLEKPFDTHNLRALIQRFAPRG